MTEACVLCEQPLSRLGPRKNYVYAVCDSCGSVQLVPMPTEDELLQLYATEYHESDHVADPEHHLQHRRRPMEFLADRLGDDGSSDQELVVELGCGWGTFGNIVRERNIPYLGLEPSVAMSAYGRETYGLEIVNAGLEYLEDNEDVARRVRTLVMIGLFEHLPDPVAMLRRILRVLPSNASVAIQSPTAGIPRTVGRVYRRVAPSAELPQMFQALLPPWHTCIPSPRGVRVGAQRAGAEIVSIEPSASGRVFNSWRYMQAANEVVGTVGSKWFGENWPLVAAHVIVMRGARGSTPPS